MRHEFSKVYSRKKRTQRNSRTVFDPHRTATKIKHIGNESKNDDTERSEIKQKEEEPKKPSLYNEKSMSDNQFPRSGTTINTNTSSMSETPNISLSKLSMHGHMAQSPEKDHFSSLMSPTPGSESASTRDLRNDSTITAMSATPSSIISTTPLPKEKQDYSKIGVIPETKVLSKLHDQLSTAKTTTATTTTATTTIAGYNAHNLITPSQISLDSDDIDELTNKMEQEQEEEKKEKVEEVKPIKYKKEEYRGYPEDIDIFVFGAQEMGLDSKVFGQMLKSLVGPSNYCVLTHKRMSGIYIGILVKRSLVEFISKPRLTATRTGIGNFYGNKGAVGVSFRINRTAFCFINAHLAANRSNKSLKDRIEDLVLIVQGLDLGNKQIDFTHQFHVMYLLGDLNFRIRGNYSSDKVVNMIDKGNYLKLLANDELTTLRAPYCAGRNAANSFIQLTNNPLFDATRPAIKDNNKLRKTNTDPLLNTSMDNMSDNDNDDDGYCDVILRSQTTPSNFLNVPRDRNLSSQKERLLSAASNGSNEDSSDFVSYEETIALFKSNTNSLETEMSENTEASSKNIMRFRKDSPGNEYRNANKRQLEHIDETKQDDRQEIVTLSANKHQRNLTTIIYGDIGDQASTTTINQEPTRNRQVSATSASATSRSPSSTIASGDDEWDDDIEDDEDFNQIEEEKSPQQIITISTDEQHIDDQHIDDFADKAFPGSLKSVPEKQVTDIQDPSIYSIHTVDGEQILLENEEKLTIEIDHESSSTSRRKRKDKKKKKKYKKDNKKKDKDKDKDEEMLNLLPMLQSFVEGPINFEPTYKFEKGRDQYTSKRIPAWCDRILWVSPPHPAVNIKQMVYTSSNITPPISDHRPVFSEFHITYNKCWDPPEKSQWLVSIKNFYLYLYPLFNQDTNNSSSSRSTTPRHHVHVNSAGSMDMSRHHIRDSSTSIVPYMTVHSPMLATCMRTTMGRRVKPKHSNNHNNNNNSNSTDNMGKSLNSDISLNPSMKENSNSLTDDVEISSLLCYKFNTKQFVVRCIDNNNLGNGCLWIVIRDDNLLGDVDVIGASAIPLIDTIKLAKHIYDGDHNHVINSDYTKYNDVYIHFKRDVTYSTCKRGYIEGQMKCEVMH